MDYQAEQEMEIEALQSILMDDFAGKRNPLQQDFIHVTPLPGVEMRFVSQRNSADATEVDGPSPSGWSDNAKCYRIGLPTGEAESMQQSGASSSEPCDLKLTSFCQSVWP